MVAYVCVNLLFLCTPCCLGQQMFVEQDSLFSRGHGLPYLHLCGYCHHLCPHGFLQQWFIKLPIKPLKIPSALHKLLSKLPSLLLVIIVASLFLGASLNLADFEAFDAWLWRSAGIATIVIAILGLLAALFIPLAYCKYGCPTGALFRFLRKTSATEKFSSRDLIVGLLLIAVTFS